MQVVYSPAHLGHDISVETYMGMPVPANEVAERAERIRAALAADGGFPSNGPTEHGEGPITAVHDPGLVRFLEVAWSELRAQGIARPFLSADTYPNRAMFEGMSEEAVAALAREPVQVGGRAGFWGLDSAAPLVAGTYTAARAAVDVALTAVDLVLGGAPAAYGLCRPPGHHAARSMYGGYCFFNNAAIAAEAIVRATGERLAILDVDYHHGNGSQQIFWRRADVRYVSIHADPDSDYPYFLGRADETGEGPGAGENLNIPLRPGTTNDEYLTAVDRAVEAIAAVPGSVVVVSLGFDTYGLDPIGSFALTTDVYHEVGRRTAALGRRLVILQEGGYHRPSLGENARTWLRGAEGRPFDPSPRAGSGSVARSPGRVRDA
jgi:acetoin utilization deacetylase AcuC-like enzyme